MPDHPFGFFPGMARSFVVFLLPALLAFLPEKLCGQALRINEVMSSNSSTTDENGDFEDWLEVHNPGTIAVNLQGWALSDDPAEPLQWTLPGIVLEPEQYLLIWASGKDRRAGAELHTNFRISDEGEELTLRDAGGIVRDRLDPIAIPANISYGRSIADPNTWTFSFVPTPGAANAGAGGHLLPETVVFSESSRTFTGSLTLALSGAGEGQSIHFTTNGSVPTTSSALYGTSITFYSSLTVRARVFDSTGAGGPVTSHHFLRLDASVADRKSNLPMVVLDARGQALSGTIERDGFFHLFDRGADGISALARPPALSARQGLRLRGSTSEGQPKKPYAVEFWNESDDDLPRELLGMAPDSDWVFYAPYNYDRAYIRNSLPYELSRRIGSWASDTRFVEVFVNHNGGTLTANDYMGVYAIIERIKQGDHRLGHDNVNRRDVPPEDLAEVTAPGPWTGGYIFKIDRANADEYVWHTERGIPTINVSMVLSRPEMTNLDGGPYTSRTTAAASSRQLAYIVGYVQQFENALYNDRAGGFATRSYLNFIDRDSWVDHVLINAFAKNVDALRLSAFFHKPQDRPINAGPVWDFDRSMDSYDLRDDAWFTWYGTSDSTQYFHRDWWGVIAQDPDYIQAFYDRWAEVRRSAFAESSLFGMVQAMGDEIDNSAKGLGSAAARDAARWSANVPRGGSYQNEIHHIRNWAVNRAAWMDRRRIDGGLLPAPPLMIRQEGSGTVTLQGAGEDPIFFTTDGSDPRASGGGLAGTFYTSPITINGPTTITARVRDGGGHWSTPAKETFTLSPSDLDGATLHYWSFNAGALDPLFTIAGASLGVSPGPTTEITFDTGADFAGIDNRFGEETGAHFRINNPLGATVGLLLPTTGYENIVFRYESRHSGQGAGLQQLSYTLDGVNYTPWPNPVTVEDGVPQLYAFKFSEIAGASDNPNFAVRISFAQGSGGVAGNNRFDNLALTGTPLPGTNQPPHVVSVPGLREIIAAAAPETADLTNFFQDPDGDPLTFAAESSGSAMLVATIDGNVLVLQGNRQGEATVFVQANDGTNSPVSLSFRVLVFPAPFAVADGTFLFDNWSSSEPAGNYPSSMLFLQTDIDDPKLAEPRLFAYRIPEEDAASASDADFPYAATSRTRITGHGSSGISFVNTGRGRDLGAALLALDTRRAVDIDVTWTAGTVAPNNRVYGLRLQARTGVKDAWSDVLDAGQAVEYIRHETTDETILGPIRLPELLEGESYVQLRWVYHHISGTSGPRAQLRLDDIVVTAVERDSYAAWIDRVFPDPADRVDPDVSGPWADPRNEGVPNLLRYALEIDPSDSGRASLPQPDLADGRLSLLFHRSAPKSDIGYLVEASADLTDWSEILYDSRTDLQANTDGKWMRVFDSIPLADGGGSRFLRLRITGQ